MKTVDHEYLLTVLDKAEGGPVVEEKEWDQKFIGAKVKELVEKYEIDWDPVVLVPDDDSLADRLFQAGRELALASGAYCVSTRRQMIWEQSELDGVINSAPSELTVGEGDDTATIKHRRPEENAHVTPIGGAYGTLIPEELFIPMVTAYARESLLEIIETPSIPTAYGRTIRIQSPWEAVTAKREAEMAMEAIAQAGRPGVCVGAAATSGSEIIELAATTYGAFRQTDWHHASLISENKVSYADLTRAVHFAQTGTIAHTFCDPIYGGYLGGRQGLAIGCVAGCLIERAVLLGDTVNAGPSHAHLSCDTHPDMIAAQALAFQAVARNTHLLNAVHIRPMAGPGVRDLLYEVGAMVVMAVVSGVDYMKTVQSATGRHMGHTTPLEARFCAQVAHAVEGMTRAQAEPIVRYLVEKYEDDLMPQQIGSPFQDIYDLDTLKPKDGWQRTYDEVCQEMEQTFSLTL
jgi:methylamine--corrinoid protein Co-methyltransferase